MAVWTDQVLYDRLWEIACRAQYRSTPVFTRFLTPPEGELALALGNKAEVRAELYGGYMEAERQICAYYPQDEDMGYTALAYPIKCLEIGWNAKFASPPGHRDLMGSIMGLGIDRSYLGDLTIVGDKAYLFATNEMAQLVASQLESAGRTSVTASVLKEIPEMPLPEGETFADTVASMRLDSVLAAGLKMSRAKAAEVIRQGRAKINHQETDRIDQLVNVSDIISIRGFGRIRVEKVGMPTRKDRLPITLRRFGIKK